MARNSRKKARAAVVLLSVAAASLAVVVACLPARSDPAPAAAAESAAGGQVNPPARDPVPVPAAPAAGTVVVTALPPAARPQRPERAGRLALVFDDAGYSLGDLEPFLKFPGPLTIAVLPNLPHSREAARRIREAGKGLILHMPMEPMGNEDPGPGAIRTGQSDQAIEGLLAAAFASVPGATGMNNHMGSRATADVHVMDVVSAYLKGEDKFFLDSRTTAETVGAREASRAGLPYLQRSVFLDDEPGAAGIEASVAAGIAEARSRGAAILIGHVHTPGILAIVQRRLAAEPETEMRLVGLGELRGGERYSGR
jgi:uncharacterized protein